MENDDNVAHRHAIQDPTHAKDVPEFHHCTHPMQFHWYAVLPLTAENGKYRKLTLWQLQGGGCRCSKIMQ